MKIVQILKYSKILLKGVNKTIKNETRDFQEHQQALQDLAGNLLSGMGYLMPPHPLTNFEIHKYYKNEPRFNGVFSRDISHTKKVVGHT